MAKLQVCHAIDLWHFEYLLLLFASAAVVVVPSFAAQNCIQIYCFDSIRLDLSNFFVRSFIRFVLQIEVENNIRWPLFKCIILLFYFFYMYYYHRYSLTLRCCCFGSRFFYYYYFDIKQNFYCICLSIKYAAHFYVSFHDALSFSMLLLLLCYYE